MALTLSNLQPRFSSPLHHTQTSLNTRPKLLHLPPKTKLQFSLSSSNRRLNYILPPKSASINGFSVQNNPEGSSRDYGEENVEFGERLRRWAGFLRSILPGGSWWSFSEDVEVGLVAKPVTVVRALQRMWQLIAQDRLVIIAAFSALVLTAKFNSTKLNPNLFGLTTWIHLPQSALFKAIAVENHA